MDNSQFRDNWHEFKEAAKKRWGQLTDEDLLECERDYEKFLALVQKRCSEQKDAVESWTNDWYSKREQEEIRRRHDTISRNQM